jgi:hypothetical protein
MGHWVGILSFAGERRTVSCVPVALKCLYYLVNSWSTVNLWIWLSSCAILTLKIDMRMIGSVFHHTTHTLYIDQKISYLYYSKDGRCHCPKWLWRYQLPRCLFTYIVLMSLLLLINIWSYAKGYHVFVSICSSQSHFALSISVYNQAKKQEAFDVSNCFVVFYRS